MNKTQSYSSWGDKLLQHTDVLHSIQKAKTFKPITIQLAINEVCESHCPFCSVDNRPIKSVLPFLKIQKIVSDFKALGAKSVEITGGGNPMLYRDGDKNINDVISYIAALGMDVGIITNSHNLSKIHVENHEKISWIRVSLIKLDEGMAPEDYNFNGFPYKKLGFSYIIYSDPQKTMESLNKIVRLVDLHPEIKFVRIAGNCLIKGNNKVIKDDYEGVIKELDSKDKFFIKEIGDNDSPFDDGCYIGAIRPYIAPSPNGGDYQVYICTSHVLNHRNYDLDYSLGSVDNIFHIWEKMNYLYLSTGKPYEVKCNGGKNWCATCKYCYYKFNNQILHTVAQEMPDKNFP